MLKWFAHIVRHKTFLVTMQLPNGYELNAHARQFWSLVLLYTYFHIKCFVINALLCFMCCWRFDFVFSTVLFFFLLHFILLLLYRTITNKYFVVILVHFLITIFTFTLFVNIWFIFVTEVRIAFTMKK